MMAAKSLLRAAALIFFMALLQSAPLSRAQSPGERIWTTPPFGAFYSLQMGGTNYPPFPFLPFDPIDVPTYVLDPAQHTYIYDDSEIDYDELNSLETFNTSPPGPPGEGGGSNGGAGHSIAYDYGTNDLWLEIFPVTTNFTVPLLLHGVKSNYYYRLDQTTHLQPSPAWQKIQLVHNATGTNVLAFSEVPTGKEAKFFRTAEGIREIQIVFEGNAVDSTDTNIAVTGSFYVQHLGEPLQTNLAIHLAISGYKGSISAENGMDYRTISNTVVIPANEAQVRVLVDPIGDDEIEFCEFATFTLLANPSYLIDPDNASVTI